ncbi:MAG: glycosyltransferase family 39 protein [Cytophagales bacterium]|nr:glycosyltransferase family 39 protein [Cytophagales bacterium]
MQPEKHATRRPFAVYLFFALYLAAGLLSFKGYGVSTDETINRQNGLVTAKYLIKKAGIPGFENNPAFRNIFDLHTYVDKDYGVVFELPLVLLERVVGIEDNNSAELWYLRHLCTFLVFYLGVIYFYQLVKLRFGSRSLALLGCFFLVVSPRIFAESFYNGKDVIFLAFFIIATYYLVRFLRQKTVPNAVLLGLSAAVATDTRILGILIPCVAIFFTGLDALHLDRDKTQLRQRLVALAAFLAAFAGFVVLFWPYLWEDPAGNFVQAFRNMSKFRWNNEVLYRGEHIAASQIPWHYVPVWLTITTPLLYTGLFGAGTVLIAARAFSRLPRLYATDAERDDLVFAGLFFGPLLAVIVMHSVLYDGWRQMYFLYGSFLLVALRGLHALREALRTRAGRPAVATAAVAGLAVLLLTPTLYWMVKNHPYQHVYFNALAGRNIETRFERDYWGLSYRQALDYIFRTDGRSNLLISANLSKPAKSNLNLMDKQHQARVAMLDKEDILPAERAHYYVTEYRYRRTKPIPGREVFNVRVDGFKIIAVYKIR